MTATTDTAKNFNALISHCIHVLEASDTNMGADTAAKLKLVTPLQVDLEIQRPDLPFAKALDAVHGTPFQSLISQIMHYFPWRLRDAGDWTLFTPNAPVDRAAFSWIELVGPEGVSQADDLSMGLYWQQAGIKYPKHRHNAEELYHIISGSALWYADSTGEQIRDPGSSFTHSSLEDHATETTTEAVLAMWAWRGDLGSDSYSKDPV